MPFDRIWIQFARLRTALNSSSKETCPKRTQDGESILECEHDNIV